MLVDIKRKQAEAHVLSSAPPVKSSPVFSQILLIKKL